MIQDVRTPPYPHEVELRDGTLVSIRPIAPEDAQREQEFVRRLSPESRYFRFMNTILELSPEMLEGATHQAPAALAGIEALGKALFFDPNLSVNGTQSFAACHAPEVGFTGPDSAINSGGAVYQGALPLHFGNRKPPASAYAGDSPLLYFNETKEGWFGGMFWDGRATGAVLGDPLAEQGQGPFLNPLEQAIANAQVLCVKVKKAGYAGFFEQVFGQPIRTATEGGDIGEDIKRALRHSTAYTGEFFMHPAYANFVCVCDLFMTQ